MKKLSLVVVALALAGCAAAPQKPTAEAKYLHMESYGRLVVAYDYVDGFVCAKALEQGDKPVPPVTSKCSAIPTEPQLAAYAVGTSDAYGPITMRFADLKMCQAMHAFWSKTGSAYGATMGECQQK